MKAVLAAILLGLAAPLLHAGEPAELKELRSRFNQPSLEPYEASREKYVMDLARLRFRLVNEGGPDWQAVDREIIAHPAPADSDSAALSRSRLGQWHSSRHDYLFDANGTWHMNDDPGTTTHGTWSITGAQYTETFVSSDGASVTTFTIVLADAENFIFTDGTHLFFETHNLAHGLPIRGDAQG